MGIAPTSEVVIVNKTTGAMTNYGAGPKIPPNKGFMTGLAFDNQDNLYVANTDHASIIHIPIIMNNGSAGAPEVIVGPDCTNLNGADGIVISDKNNSDNDNIIVAVNKLNKIVQVSLMNNSVTVLDSNGVLDFPATIEIDTDERGQ